MQESQTLTESPSESVAFERHNRIPVWLVFVYATLLIWTIWNLVRYWD